MIIGILATMAVPQYQKMVNKAKWGEAISMLGTIKNACMIYFLEFGVYPAQDSGDGIMLNGSNKGKNNAGGGDYMYIVNRLPIDLPDIKPDGRFLYSIWSGSAGAATLDSDGSGFVNAEKSITMGLDGTLISQHGAPDF